MRYLTEEQIHLFKRKLEDEEKAPATICKYLDALTRLGKWLDGQPLCKKSLLEYKEVLLAKNCAGTVNGHFSAINAFLKAAGWEELRVRLLKVQGAAFLEDSKELSEEEYKRLLAAARAGGNQRLYLLMLTLGSTGIRISELKFITAEAVDKGKAEIRMKGKIRTILLQKEMCRKLKEYKRRQGIDAGPVFCTRSGRAVDRSNICHEMKKLCHEAGVNPEKVFPHNFRHLFARVFYRLEKNLAHLADILGHTRLETTRIYLSVSASSHQKTLSRMNLIV